MQRAVEAFESDFARWDLHLPAEAIESRRAGQIRHAGWSIRYNFGRDGRGEYLDYYASPRDVREDPPGDDWHVRLYDSGERAVLPAVLEAYMYGRDPTWEELERARRQYAASTPESQTNVSAPAESLAGGDDVEVTEILPNGPEGDGATPPSEAVAAEAVQADPVAASDGEAEESAEGDAPSNAASEVASDAASDAAVPYLPLDIGLHVELELAPGGSASAQPAPGSPPSAASPADEPPADLFYAPEDLVQFLPALPAEPNEGGAVAEEQHASASVLFRSSRDDIPAPITLATAVEETTPRPGDIISEEDEPPAATLSREEADSVEAIDAVSLGEPDTLSRVPTENEPADVAHDASTGGVAAREGPTGVPASPPLAGKAIPTKIFRRADPVLTADVARIDLHVNPQAFRPWWFRPNARRAAIAIAAAVIIAIVVVARAHHRARAAQAFGSDIDTSAMSAPPAAVAPPVPTDSSARTSDTGASPDSQPGSAVDSATPVSAPAQDQATEPTPALRPPTPDPGDHNADDGMAKPAGPKSLSPIVPAGKSGAGAASKYPAGTFPRGYNP